MQWSWQKQHAFWGKSQTRSHQVCSTAFHLKDNQKTVECHNFGAVGEDSIANSGKPPNLLCRQNQARGVCSTCGLSSSLCMRKVHWAHLSYQLWLVWHQCTVLADPKTAEMALGCLQVYVLFWHHSATMWVHIENSRDQSCPERSEALLHLQSKPCSGSCTDTAVIFEHFHKMQKQDVVLVQLACKNRTAMIKLRMSVLWIKATSLGVQSLSMRCKYSILVIIAMQSAEHC